MGVQKYKFSIRYKKSYKKLLFRQKKSKLMMFQKTVGKALNG
jgi:hypothetical protein